MRAELRRMVGLCAILGLSAGCQSSSHTSVRYHEREERPGVRPTADDDLNSEYQMQSPGEMVSPGEMIVDPHRDD